MGRNMDQFIILICRIHADQGDFFAGKRHICLVGLRIECPDDIDLERLVIRLQGAVQLMWKVYQPAGSPVKVAWPPFAV